MILAVDGIPGPSQREGPKRSGLGVPGEEGSVPSSVQGGVAEGGGAAERGAAAKVAAKASGDSVRLSPEASALVAKLKARDADVRAHEAAHIAAGGSVVKGGASFTYQNGPDGESYAVGGEVGVDTSPVPNNPSATIAKANTIRAAALAPADPSPQDLSVASEAIQMAADAAEEMAKSYDTSGAVKSLQGQAGKTETDGAVHAQPGEAAKPETDGAVHAQPGETAKPRLPEGGRPQVPEAIKLPAALRERHRPHPGSLLNLTA